jgi:hypothetical protein
MCYFLKAYNAEKVGEGRERKGGMQLDLTHLKNSALWCL